jgi:hypothetical protein
MHAISPLLYAARLEYLKKNGGLLLCSTTRLKPTSTAVHLFAGELNCTIDTSDKSIKFTDALGHTVYRGCLFLQTTGFRELQKNKITSYHTDYLVANGSISTLSGKLAIALLNASSVKVMKLMWGCTPKKAAAICGAYLWEHLDKEVLSLGIKLYGNKLNSEGYTFLWQHLEYLRDVPPIVSATIAHRSNDGERYHSRDSVILVAKSLWNVSDEEWDYLCSLSYSSASTLAWWGAAKSYKAMNSFITNLVSTKLYFKPRLLNFICRAASDLSAEELVVIHDLSKKYPNYRIEVELPQYLKSSLIGGTWDERVHQYRLSSIELLKGFTTKGVLLGSMIGSLAYKDYEVTEIETNYDLLVESLFIKPQGYFGPSDINRAYFFAVKKSNKRIALITVSGTKVKSFITVSRYSKDVTKISSLLYRQFNSLRKQKLSLK